MRDSLSIYRHTRRTGDHSRIGEEDYRSYTFGNEGVHHSFADTDNTPIDSMIEQTFFWQKCDEECDFTIKAFEIVFERNHNVSYSLEMETAYFKSIETLLRAALNCNFEPIKNADQKEFLYFIKKITNNPTKDLAPGMRLFKSTAVINKVNASSENLCMQLTLGVQNT